MTQLVKIPDPVDQRRKLFFFLRVFFLRVFLTSISRCNKQKADEKSTVLAFIWVHVDFMEKEEQSIFISVAWFTCKLEWVQQALHVLENVSQDSALQAFDYHRGQGDETKVIRGFWIIHFRNVHNGCSFPEKRILCMSLLPFTLPDNPHAQTISHLQEACLFFKIQEKGVQVHWLGCCHLFKIFPCLTFFVIFRRVFHFEFVIQFIIFLSILMSLCMDFISCPSSTLLFTFGQLTVLVTQLSRVLHFGKMFSGLYQNYRVNATMQLCSQ